MGLAQYQILPQGDEWGVLHDGDVKNTYATKEAAFEAAVAAASLAIREGMKSISACQIAPAETKRLLGRRSELVGPTAAMSSLSVPRDYLQGVVCRWSLQHLGLIPRRADPYVALFIGQQDHPAFFSAEARRDPRPRCRGSGGEGRPWGRLLSCSVRYRLLTPFCMAPAPSHSRRYLVRPRDRAGSAGVTARPRVAC